MVLDFKTVTLMVDKNWIVEQVVSESFLKCGGIYFDARVIINYSKEAALHQSIPDFVDSQFDVTIISWLLGGAR